MNPQTPHISLSWSTRLRRHPWVQRLVGCTFLFFLAKGLAWLALFAWVVTVES